MADSVNKYLAKETRWKEAEAVSRRAPISWSILQALYCFHSHLPLTLNAHPLKRKQMFPLKSTFPKSILIFWQLCIKQPSQSLA